MNPRVAICLLTYQRTEYALRTIRAIKENLKYDNYAWYLADSGSPFEHWAALWAEIGPCAGHHPNDGHILNPGENWNLAIRQTFEHEIDYYLRLEEDFVLDRPLELERYVRLLEKNQGVGMVRFGLMPINLEMESFGFEGDIFMNIYKNRQYCFSGHPCLVHRRFHEAYGYFPENEPLPGNCELALDAQVRSKDGPQVWWPLKMGEWGAFGHIGEVKA